MGVLGVPVRIEGVLYATLPELLQEMKITRQTLWRWRHDGHIPPGRRTRSRQVLFTKEDAAALRRYANRVEPISGIFRKPTRVPKRS